MSVSSRQPSIRPVPDAIAERLPLAATAFATRGFDSTRIDDVAEATGIGGVPGAV